MAVRYLNATGTQFNINETKRRLALKADQTTVTALQQTVQGVADSIPTKTSDLTNDSGFITNDDVAADYATKSSVDNLTSVVQSQATDIATLNADSSTAGSVDYKIAHALVNVSSFKIVSALPSDADASESTLYFLTESAGVYSIHVYSGGNWLTINDLTAVKSAIEALSTSTATNTSDISTLQTLLTNLTSDVSDNTTAIATNTTAISTINGTDTGSSMRDVAEDVVSTIPKAITPKGTIEFADLPALADSEIGDMYNIEDAFTTTADFIMGAGTSMSANSNVYVIDAGSGTKKWDVFATGGIADMSAYQTKTLTSHTGITATTVETALEEVASTAADNASDISDLQTTVGDSTSGLVKAVADNVAALAKLDKAALSVLTLPTASAELENMVRFNVADEKWYLCTHDTETDTYSWKDLSPVIPTPDLSKYSKNLIIDKAENITAAQKEEYDTFDTTDNECGMVFGEVAEGDHNAVDGDSVYKAIANTKSPIVTRYYGSQTVSVTTYNRLTIVCASRYPTCAGAWLILNNYSSAPACIELGKASNSTMSVTASVDTTDSGYGKTNVQVTVGSASYEWDIVQIPF